MTLVHLVEHIIQNLLILPVIKKLSKVTLYDFYVSQYHN